jgi:AraC-like DNA-binding protein
MLLGLTRRTLQRRLYETGTSFQKVVIATRISVAEKLLSETSSPITRIASDVGFATLQAFSSAFRRETGLSPSGYRSAALKVPASDARAADRSEPAHERAAALDDRDLLDGFETITSPPPASGARLIANESLKIAASG